MYRIPSRETSGLEKLNPNAVKTAKRPINNPRRLKNWQNQVSLEIESKRED